STSSSLVGTSPATLPGSEEAHSGRMVSPDLPASSRDHATSVPQPSGETSPIPVTTIRRMSGPDSWRYDGLLPELGGEIPIMRQHYRFLLNFVSSDEG